MSENSHEYFSWVAEVPEPRPEGVVVHASCDISVLGGGRVLHPTQRCEWGPRDETCEARLRYISRGARQKRQHGRERNVKEKRVRQDTARGCLLLMASGQSGGKGDRDNNDPGRHEPGRSNDKVEEALRSVRPE